MRRYVTFTFTLRAAVTTVGPPFHHSATWVLTIIVNHSRCPGSASTRAAAGLAQWWAEHAEADLRRRCEELRESFAEFDLVPLVERHTGVRFDDRAVELCVLRWAAPHGIRVTGTRFSPTGVMRPAGSSTLPCTSCCTRRGRQDHPVKGPLDRLAADPFLAARFARRDPAAGYNTRGDPATRWTTADDGMHVLAYCCMTPCSAEISTPRAVPTLTSSPVPCQMGRPGPLICKPGISS